MTKSKSYALFTIFLVLAMPVLRAQDKAAPAKRVLPHRRAPISELMHPIDNNKVKRSGTLVLSNDQKELLKPVVLHRKAPVMTSSREGSAQLPSFDQYEANMADILGAPRGRVTTLRDGKIREYANGALIQHSDLPACFINGAILKYWYDNGAEKGVLGYPATDITGMNNGGWYAAFEGDKPANQRIVCWRPNTGCFDVRDELMNALQQKGGFDVFGYPLGGVASTPYGPIMHFERGTICISPAFETPMVWMKASNEQSYIRVPDQANSGQDLKNSDAGINLNVNNNNAHIQLTGTRMQLQGNNDLYYICGVRPITGNEDLLTWDNSVTPYYNFKTQPNTIYRFCVILYYGATELSGLTGHPWETYEYYFLSNP